MLHTHVRPPPDTRTLDQRLDGALEQQETEDMEAAPEEPEDADGDEVMGEALKRLAESSPDDAELGKAVRQKLQWRASP